MACSHHGDSRLDQNLGIATHIKNGWRIIDFLQALWVQEIVDGN
jgi:hypothetical protein